VRKTSSGMSSSKGNFLGGSANIALGAKDIIAKGKQKNMVIALALV
jgi:hypothetical protein